MRFLLAPMLLAYGASAIPLGVSNSSSSSDPHLDKRATVIADGTSLQSGTLGPGVDWQASGVLSEGCECVPPCLCLAPRHNLATL